MIEGRTIVAALSALMLMTTAGAAERPQIPVSPSSVLATGPEQGSEQQRSASKPAPASGGDSATTRTSQASDSSDQTVEPVTLTLKPGVTEVLPIAKDHLNRIVTPYTNPQVRTTANAKIQVKNHVVYVASASEAPITVYVMPRDSESQALSLALVPRQIPPREITLQLADDEGGARIKPVDRAAAQDWEQSQPYVEAIEELMSGLARGQVPSGFGLDSITAGMNIPSCGSPPGAELTYDFVGIGQRLTGGSLIAYVGRVTNTDDETIELDERWCRSERVVASAFWPRIMLEPGQQAEVYVVRSRRVESGTPERPSLLEN